MSNLVITRLSNGNVKIDESGVIQFINGADVTVETIAGCIILEAKNNVYYSYDADTLTVNGSLVTGTTAQRAEALATNAFFKSATGGGGIGNKVSMLGTSITLGNGVHTGVLEYRGNADPLAWASLLTDSKIFYHINAGVGGNTTTQMLARVQTDIISKKTDWCIVEGGMNDALQNFSYDTFKSNIIAICNALKGSGIKVALCAVSPSSDTTAKTLIPKFNAFLSYYAYTNRFPFIDIYKAMANADGTGSLATAYNSGDGTHPNSAGGKVMGQAIVDSIGSLIGNWNPYLAIVQTNSQNLLPNGLNVDTNADGLADNYTKTGTGTTTVLTSDVGRAQRIVATDGTATTVYQASTSGWSVGDRMAFSCKVEGAPTSPSKISLYITFAGPFTQHFLLRDVDVIVEKHILYYEFTVPASTTGIRAFIASGTGGTNADIRFSQVTLVNLATLPV